MKNMGLGESVEIIKWRWGAWKDGKDSQWDPQGVDDQECLPHSCECKVGAAFWPGLEAWGGVGATVKVSSGP